MVYTLSEKRQLLATTLLDIASRYANGRPWAQDDSITACAYERQIKAIDRLIEAFPNA